MSTFKPVITDSNSLENVAKVDGQLVAVYDSGELYIDKSIGNNVIRTKYSDVVVDTFNNIDSLVAPSTDKIYFATDTHQLLQVNYGTGNVKEWIDLGGGGGGSSTLAGLTDVTISSPTSGQALVYNGSGWINGSTTGSGGTKVVTENGATSLQAVTNLTPDYAGNTRGNGAVDLQQVRGANSQIASGAYSVVMGHSNTSNGPSSVAAGAFNIASGYYSVVMGYNNTASGDYSVAMGGSTTVSGLSSVALGLSNIARGYCSAVMGAFNTAGGDYSAAMGAFNAANGEYSVVMGGDNRANGRYSVATGNMNTCAIPGAVTNNNALDEAVLQYNKFGHTGFKGFNSSNFNINLFNLSNTDVLIARIDVINSQKIASYFVVVAASGVQSCTITVDIYNSASTGDIYMANGVLKLYSSSESVSQVGMFYTLYSNTAGGGGGYSSSSSSSGSSY